MSAQTKATLDGLYKDVYADDLSNLVPDFGILVKMIGFKPEKKTGRDYVKPVKLSNEHGFTYGSGLATLQDIISSDVDDAKVRGSSMTLRSGFSYDAAANMSSSRGSFETATKFRFKAMMESATHRLEAQMLYGSVGLGVADSSQDSVTVVVDTKNVVIPILPASWAAGVWAGQEGANISLFTTAADTPSAAEGASAVNQFEIASVNNSTKTITVITKDANEADALVIEIEAADYNIYFYGAFSNEMVGLRSIASNTGTLYGIPGASYGLWQGNTYSAGSAVLTLAKILAAINLAVAKGLRGPTCCLVSPASFADLSNAESGLRRYGAEKKGSRGMENIMFYGTSGPIEIVVHPMVKDGEAIAFPKDKAERIGATDLTFKTPGREEEMFQQSPTLTGYEVRLYSEQAIFLPAPSHCVYINNITPT